MFVPVRDVTVEEAAAATRALAARAERLDPALATTAYLRGDRGSKVYLDPTRAGGATVVTAYSPRIRPGVPVSFPVAWEDLERVAPGDFTIHTAPRLLAGADLWADGTANVLARSPRSFSCEESSRRIPATRRAADLGLGLVGLTDRCAKRAVLCWRRCERILEARGRPAGRGRR